MCTWTRCALSLSLLASPILMSSMALSIQVVREVTFDHIIGRALVRIDAPGTGRCMPLQFFANDYRVIHIFTIRSSVGHGGLLVVGLHE
jgi:hypothetical protein